MEDDFCSTVSTMYLRDQESPILERLNKGFTQSGFLRRGYAVVTRKLGNRKAMVKQAGCRYYRIHFPTRWCQVSTEHVFQGFLLAIFGPTQNTLFPQQRNEHQGIGGTTGHNHNIRGWFGPPKISQSQSLELHHTRTPDDRLAPKSFKN